MMQNVKMVSATLILVFLDRPPKTFGEVHLAAANAPKRQKWDS